MTKLKLLTNLVDKDKNVTLTADTLHDFTIKDGFYKINYPDSIDYTLISNDYRGKLFDLVEVEELTADKLEAIVVTTQESFKEIGEAIKKVGGKKKNETV